MSPTARQLRIQMSYSSDQDFLEGMAPEKERRAYHPDASVDMREARKCIALCLDQIAAIVRSDIDAVRRFKAVRNTVDSCCRSLEQHNHDASGARAILRTALADQSLKRADLEPKLGLWLERAIDFV